MGSWNLKMKCFSKSRITILDENQFYRLIMKAHYQLVKHIRVLEGVPCRQSIFLVNYFVR